MNAHERIPEATGTGVTPPGHGAVPGTANVTPCGHGGWAQKQPNAAKCEERPRTLAGRWVRHLTPQCRSSR
jgi:hypothetical protein